MDLLVDGSDIAPTELISQISKTPLSSLEPFDENSGRGLMLGDPPIGQLPHQIDSNVAQPFASSAHTSIAIAYSAGLEQTQETNARYAQLCQQRKLMEPAERQPLPNLHLHLSKDGTSSLPPGWQRAPNVKREANRTAKDGSVGAS
ncbi:Histone-lysine N-methyltransferase SETD2 [Fasciolopsis buskii]|uniref:Histone-lysine N-methyltransferase SETD2 n=1 Tax=Fasciolopsis buskii TaxID=27845 RepID=A0A8E0RKS2_9TREM|nr:Histone-lysine N-methyltransferase SETD2 [Fasciolopsis buski]